jgi:dTDP-4-dehydrorhamnose 3,5-epimerase
LGDVTAAAPAIQGVRLSALKQYRDELGGVFHMLRADSPLFEGFGEVYFSLVAPRAVKAWKRHQRMVQNFAVPVGAIRLVLFDDRNDSATRGVLQELEVGEDRYVLVRIPPLVWYGFQGLGPNASLIANCATIPHDPAEVDRLSPEDPAIPYSWSVG